MGNLKSPVNFSYLSPECGKNSEHPEGTRADTGRACKIHKEKLSPGRESNSPQQSGPLAFLTFAKLNAHGMSLFPSNMDNVLHLKCFGITGDAACCRH